MSWDEGYTSEIPYVHGYYRELNPTFLNYALLHAGYDHKLAAGMNYCELGFGQGGSLCIHAAATANGSYYGTDFMPEHTYFARQLASTSGADIRLHDDSFADFFDKDLPEFDVIAMHGVLSWISDDNHQRIVDFLRRKLKVGGVFYLSYNTLPGWSQIHPLRDLFVAHQRFMGSPGGGLAKRIQSSVEFAEKLAAEDSRFFALNRAAKARLELIKTQNPAYVAHEYFNTDLKPMYFHEVNDLLEPAKLAYACSADLMDHLDAITLPKKIRDVLDGIDNRIFRETVRDYATNGQFRRDIFVKGLPRLTAVERNQRLAETSFVLIRDVSEGVKEAAGPLGKVQLRKEIFQPLLDALADEGGRPKSLGELADYPELEDRQFAVLARNVAILVAGGQLSPVQPAAFAEVSAETSARLNREILEHAKVAHTLVALASPLTGGGVHTPRVEQLFLLSYAAGHDTAKKLSQEVWKYFKVQGKGLVKDGEALKGDKENLAFLLENAETFLKSGLQRYEVLGVVDKTGG